MTETLILLAAIDSLLSRLGVLVVAILVGIVFILAGIANVKTQTAEESGRRRWVNRALGRSNTYTGKKAVTMGYVRIGMGVCTILFGIVFLFVGPFLADVGKGGARAEGGTAAPAGPPQAAGAHGPLPPAPALPGNTASRSIDRVNNSASALADDRESDVPQADAAAPQSDAQPARTAEQPRVRILPPLGDPPSAIPLIAHSPDRLVRTKPAGHAAGDAFDDKAPDSGVLVGLRVAMGDSFGGVPQAIQPIYQVEGRYVAGSWHGDPNGEQFEALAPAGYAVGAVQMRCGLVVNCVRPVFYRLAGQALDVSDVQAGAYMGVDNGDERTLDGQGNVLTGLFGSCDDSVRALGVSYLRSELPTPAEPLPALAYDANRVRPSDYLGANSGAEFVDRAPAGGILVGAVLVKGENWGGALQAIQPIYEVNGQYVRGQMCGHSGGTEITVLARPGYAVFGLRLRAGLVLNAVQLAFAPLQGTRLNSDKLYFSDWIGCEGGDPREFAPQGRALAGVFGKYKTDLCGLGVLVVDRLRLAEAAPSTSTMAASRTWTSADGKFSVVATLVEVVDNEVVLKKENGDTIRVSLDQLSDADHKFIEQQSRSQ